MTATADILPDERALQGAAGTPVVLAGGKSWLLRDGGLCNGLDEERDRLAEAAATRSNVTMAEVYEVAWRLLEANYELTPDEGAALLAGADADAVTDAVFDAMFGPCPPDRSFTAWAASALLANGLDPEKIPGPMRQHVLDQLVMTKRAVPIDRFMDAAVAAPRIAQLRAIAARGKPQPATPGAS